jgi:hypothetical protein
MGGASWGTTGGIQARIGGARVACLAPEHVHARLDWVLLMLLTLFVVVSVGRWLHLVSRYLILALFRVFGLAVRR